jgi:23S rRNA A1618 N6-methylase RlmF
MATSNSGRKRKRFTSQNNGDDTALLEQVTNPDFEHLASGYPDFDIEWQKLKQRKHSSSSSSLSTLATQDFNIALTRALIHFHFRLSLPNLPTSRLCPPIPNRFFYVEWIQSHLLPLLNNEEYFVPLAVKETTNGFQKHQRHYGCDIGTGASCIYPLLFHANLRCLQEVSSNNMTNPSDDSWIIVAADIEPVSIEAAMNNVLANQLDHVIKVISVAPTRAQREHSSNQAQAPNHARENLSEGPICSALQAWASTLQGPGVSMIPPFYFDFVMTNPPFYDDGLSTERSDPRGGDGRERTPMTQEEGSYPGGEVGFVLDMIRDSLQYAENLGWCTCMCGKKSSFNKLKGILIHLLGPAHVVTTEFGPGHMTRWFLAWTLRRPAVRSPLALVADQRRINATIANTTSGAEAVLEVTNRIRVYTESIRNWDLSFDVTESCTDKPSCTRARVRERKVSKVSVMVDDDCSELPDRISGGVSKKWNATDFLPHEGHFCIDITVRAGETDGGESIVGVEVVFDCYRHSSVGDKVVKMFLNQMEGEVTRNNRRWRRLHRNEAGNTVYAI